MTLNSSDAVMIRYGTYHNPETDHTTWLRGRPATVYRVMAGGRYVIVIIRTFDGEKFIRVNAEDLDYA